jgi:hypothetical protein
MARPLVFMIIFINDDRAYRGSHTTAWQPPLQGGIR